MPRLWNWYAWTYEYEYLVGGSETTVFARKVDVDGAVRFVVKRMWHDARTRCVHAPSGEAVS